MLASILALACLVVISPLADRVEIFEAPGRWDRLLRGTVCRSLCCGAVPAVRARSSAAHRPASTGPSPWSGGGGDGRRAHQLVQHPRSAQHRGSPVAIRGSHQNCAFAQQAPARRIRQSHAPELRAKDGSDPVVPRQTLIEESVIGGQQIDHAAIFEENAADKQFGFGWQSPFAVVR